MNTEMERRLQQLIDERDIRQLMMRYCRGVDRRDRDLIEATFHPDAICNDVNGVGEPTGKKRADLLVDPRNPMYTHFVGNEIIEVDGDEAKAEFYFMSIYEFTRDCQPYLLPTARGEHAGQEARPPSHRGDDPRPRRCRDRRRDPGHLSRYMAYVSSSCGPAVLMNQPAKPIPALDPASRHADHVHRLVGPALGEALVRPTLVIVLDELGQHRFQAPPTEDQQVVESLPPCCPHQSFGE